MARRLPEDQRRRDLATIHIARAELAMDDDTYRAILWTIGRVRSAADLDHVGRAQLLDHFRACGWRPRAKGRHAIRPNAEIEAQVSKIGALLADMRLPEAYALRIASQQTGRPVQALAWLRHAELRGVIAALVKRQQAIGQRQAAPVSEPA